MPLSIHVFPHACSSSSFGSSNYNEDPFKPVQSQPLVVYEIELESTVLQPHSELNGILSLTLKAANEHEEYLKPLKPYTIQGLRIQLDATINLQFKDKMLSLKSSVLQDCADSATGYFQSPVLFDVNAGEPLIVDPKESMKIPFTLTMPGENLPCPFMSDYGRLLYKIVIYKKSTIFFKPVAEKVLKFMGYNNLSLISVGNLYHDFDFSVQKSIFMPKQSIKIILTSESNAFLPGEFVNINLRIINPKMLKVQYITFSFIQKVEYKIEKLSKTKKKVLTEFKIDDCSRVDEEVDYTSTLCVPLNCIPSYTLKPQVFSVTYWIQYAIKLKTSTNPLKGETELVIGTTRQSVEDILINGIDLSGMEETEDNLHFFSLSHRNRSGSLTSVISDTSTISTLSLPPNYSSLSSRSNSMISLETLPPHYEEVDERN